MPCLTIISVVRHDQLGLDKSIASVSEECPWAEHLVVDGSDQPLIVAVSRPTLRVRHERDRGISHAFNRGVIHATGDYVLFLNAGDSLAPGAGERLRAALDHATVDCVWFSVYRCFDDGSLSIYRPRLDLLKYAMAAPHQGMVLKRDVYAQIGLFPMQRYAMDHHLALRLVIARPPYRIDVHDDVIAIYPAGGHSSQGGSRPFFVNCWNVARLAPRHLVTAVLANAYLAMKSFVVHRARRG